VTFATVIHILRRQWELNIQIYKKNFLAPELFSNEGNSKVGDESISVNNKG
jgi:hypothetical protein